MFQLRNKKMFQKSSSFEHQCKEIQYTLLIYYVKITDRTRDFWQLIKYISNFRHSSRNWTVILNIIHYDKMYCFIETIKNSKIFKSLIYSKSVRNIGTFWDTCPNVLELKFVSTTCKFGSQKTRPTLFYLHQGSFLCMWQHEAKKITRLGKYSLKKIIKENITNSSSTLHNRVCIMFKYTSAKMSSVMASVLLILYKMKFFF